jgi:hypothetical protein
MISGSNQGRRLQIERSETFAGAGGSDFSPEMASTAAPRQRWAISGLRWLNLLEPRSGMINVAQGIHLELWLGWARLGLCVQRRGAALRGGHHRRARVPVHRGPTIQDG